MTGNGAPRAFKQADPCSLVVFGASGDLTHRLLVPALYNLAAGGLLPAAFTVVGVARMHSSTEAYRQKLKDSLYKFATRPVNDEIANRLLTSIIYLQGDGNDPD